MTQRRNTQQRQLVLDAVRSRCDHPTAEDIFAAVRQRNDRISRGTVYRNLNVLIQEGAIASVKVAGGADHFDRRCDEHGHLVCTGCGAIVDVPLPDAAAFDREAERRTGYVVTGHRTVLEGLCPSCQAKRAAGLGTSGEKGAGA